MNQMSPLFTQNAVSTFHSNAHQQTAGIGLIMNPSIIIQLVKDAKAIEKGSFKLFTDKQKTQFQPRLKAFLANMNLLSQAVILNDSAYDKNPYLKALLEESWNPIHLAFWSNQLPITTHDYCMGLLNRLTENIIKNKCALNFSSWKAELDAQTAEQKKKFDALLKKHKQVNCIYLGLPCYSVQGDFSNYAIEQTESSWIKVIKSFLKKCHDAELFKEKLCDMQWRFVKGLNGMLQADILMYVIGNETNYSELIHTCWREVCIKNGLSNTFIEQKSIHCYQGNGLCCKLWKNGIDCLQAPLEFYRYKANGLTYVWKTYTGNI